MVPVVVGAGLCQALGVILGGPNIADQTGTFIYFIYKAGNMAMGTMIIPVIAAAIAYSIADRPGIAPVSYTHLDVYKRQKLHRPADSGSISAIEITGSIRKRRTGIKCSICIK